MAGDLTTDPDAYFHSLPTSERLQAEHPGMTVAQRHKAGIYSQEDIFTNAAAEAIRAGADVGKVVNARRGMSTAQTVTGRRRLVQRDVLGRPMYTTTVNGKRGMVRLMPESIVELAGTDRKELLRLLKSHGYLA